MARRPFAVLSALVPLSLLVLTAAPSGAAETTTPRPDAAVQVTADPTAVRGHATPSMAVHPDDAHVLALAEGDAYNSRCSVHISTDAGLTWNTTTAPEVPDEWPGCMFATTGTIADVAFAGDGTLYFAFTGFDPRTYHQRTFLARSDDLGQRWDTVELPWVEPDPATGQSGADGLPSVVVDPDDPEGGYVGWWSNNGTWNLPEELSGGKEWCDDLIPRPWVATSSDGGRTFSGAVDLAPGVEGCMTEPYLLAGNDGELFAYFGESSSGEEGKAEPAHLFQSVSQDGGQTFTAAPIHTQSAPNDGDAADSDGDWLSAPSPGIDRESGELYVAWEDMGEGKPSIQFMRSSDAGSTWSDNLRVNDRLIDRRFGARSTGYITGPVGLASTDETAYVAWDDTRNGNEETGTQDIYATRVRFSDPATVFATEAAGTGISVAAVLLGAAGALVLGGLALVVATSTRRRSGDAS